jgi:superfamily II DNA or RNA helicase
MGDIMCLRDTVDNFKTNYNSWEDDIVKLVYGPCLANSSRFYRGTAYFRSSVLELYKQEVVDFCLSGGKIEIMTSYDLALKDVESMAEGYELRDMETLLENMLDDEYLATPTKFLCTLIATGHLDINIVHGGFYHDKVGFFQEDCKIHGEAETVAYIGSGNETFSGVSTERNYERYTLNWYTREDFDEYGAEWSRELCKAIETGEYVDGAIVDRFDKLTPEFLIKHDISSELQDFWFEKLLDLTYFDYGKLSPDGPQKHQLRAFRSWKENDQYALFEHATGTYKTATGLICADHFLKKHDNVIITTPLRIVSENWFDLLNKCFPNSINVVKCWGDNPNWIIEAIEAVNYQRKSVYVFVNNSLWGEKGEELLALLRDDYLLIADEAHNWEDTRAAEFMKSNKPISRLALTAQLSEPGYESDIIEILNYFAGQNPCIDRLGLNLAITQGFLREYEYQLEIIELEDLDGYHDNLSMSGIWSLFNEQKKNKSIQLALDTLRWKNRVLIYTGPKIQDASNIYRKLQLAWNEATSGANLFKKVTGEENQVQRNRIISDFTNGITRALVAIKVLDEGVDLPISDAAIMGRSNEKYRQWIQRRGRVLRKKDYSDNSKALVIDFVLNLSSLEAKMQNSIRSRHSSEIDRILEFSGSSLDNSHSIMDILRDSGWLDG